MVEWQLVQEWLNKADENYGFAVSVMRESPYYAQICFHFHQAAEKYLKAYIIAYGLTFEENSWLAGPAANLHATRPCPRNDSG